MDIDIRYKPSFATIFLTLEPGESIIAESGAMIGMDLMEVFCQVY